MAANKRSSVQKRIALFRVNNQRNFKRNTIEVDGRKSKTAKVPRKRTESQRIAAAEAYAKKREEKEKEKLEKEKLRRQVEAAKLRAQRAEARLIAEEDARVREHAVFDNWGISSMYDPEQAERDKFDVLWGSNSAFQPYAGHPLPPMIAPPPRPPPVNPYYRPPGPPRNPRLSPGAGRLY